MKDEKRERLKFQNLNSLPIRLSGFASTTPITQRRSRKEDHARKLIGLQHIIDTHIQYFFKIFQAGGWGMQLPPIFFRQICRICRKTKSVQDKAVKLRRHKHIFGLLPLDFFRFFGHKVRERQRPKVTQKSIGGKRGDTPWVPLMKNTNFLQGIRQRIGAKI